MRTYAYLLILMAGMFTLNACDKDDDVTPEPDNSIVDIALSDEQFSTLVTALQRTDLVSTLDGQGPFTVFAPTNTAFQQLGVDLSTISDADLRNILLYHVVPGSVESTDLQQGQTYASTAATDAPGINQLSILIDKSATGVVVNGVSTVTNADIMADNGVIHVVNQVLTPLDVVGHAQANPVLSSLVTALTSAPGDLDAALSAEGPYTVFAPVNSAFENIADVIATLTPEQLNTVLSYHVIDNANVLSSDLTNNMVVETISGQTFTIDLEAGPVIFDQSGQSTSFILNDIQATNGVIHVVNNVLIPNLEQ